MRILFTLAVLIALAACHKSQPAPPPVPVPVITGTLTWDRNSEPDMKEYRVWACWTPGCNPAVIHTMLKVIQQTAPGVKPVYRRELAGSVGAFAVTARDASGNESPFSVPVTFDRR